MLFCQLLELCKPYPHFCMLITTMTNIFIGLYIMVLMYIVYRSSHRETIEEFLDSDKSLTSTQTTWTTFASLLTGYNFVLGVTFSYLYGFWFLFVFLGLLAAFIVLYFLYKRILTTYQKDNHFFSLGDYFGVRFGQHLRFMVNMMLCLSLVLFITLQLSVNTGLFTSLLHIQPLTSLFVTAGIVGVYLWFGGFKASVSTDIFQGMLILPIILTVFYIPHSISSENISKGFEASSFMLAAGLALLQFLSLLGQAESFQRVFATKDTGSLKKGLAYASILLIVVAGSIAYIGVNYKIQGTSIDPSLLFTQGLLPTLPSWLRSLLTVSLIAAFMGTIDSSAFALGTLLAGYKKRSIENMIRATKVFMIIGIFTSAFASLYLISFLTVVFSLISLVSIIGGSVLLTFSKKTSSLEMWAYYSVAIIIFITGSIGGFITANPLTSCIPILAGFVGFMATRFLFNNNDMRYGNKTTLPHQP